MMTEYKDMATVRQTIARANAEGLAVPECALRRWVNDGTIPSVQCGRKYLVYWPNVVEFLTGRART